MKNKNKLIGSLILFGVIVFVGVVIWWKYESRDVYILDIPNSHNLSSISYELESGSITIATEEEMEKVLNGIYDLNLSTKEVSVQDMPINAEKLVPIRLYYKEEDTLGTFYIYMRNNKYYLEEPYNGVYDITEKEYNYIIDLIEE